MPLPSTEQVNAPAWSCPLQWLQAYHDDNSQFQARTPSALRNEARFHHITSTHSDAAQHYSFAHPTVQGSTKVRNIKAARFINDALACVADESACHGPHLLQKTVDSLL